MSTRQTGLILRISAQNKEIEQLKKDKSKLKRSLAKYKKAYEQLTKEGED